MSDKKKPRLLWLTVNYRAVESENGLLAIEKIERKDAMGEPVWSSVVDSDERAEALSELTDLIRCGHHLTRIRT